MADRIKISASGVEVEIEVTGITPSKLEEMAVRLFDHVAPKNEKGQRVGFVAPAVGWALNSDHERDPES